MKKSKKFILMLIFLTLFTFSACNSGIDSGKLQLQQNYDDSEAGQYKDDYDILDKGPVAGGVLNLFSTMPDTLNPIITKNSYVSDFLGFVYEGLTRTDGKQTAVAQLADSWSVSADGLVWNFHIRPDVEWHDGQPFTAEDVEFTIQTILNPSIDSIYKPLLGNISACAAVDSSNVRIVLKKPNSFTPEMMTFPILPKHQFRQVNVLAASKDFSPIGTGAYKYVQYKENEKVELSLNKKWWYLEIEAREKDDGFYIETLNIEILTSQSEAMGELQTGEIDVVDIETSDFVKYRSRNDLVVKMYTSRNFEFLSFNFKNKIMADKYVRKAIALAIDRERIISDVLPGEAEASDMPVLPGSFISDIEGVSIDISDIGIASTSHAGISYNGSNSSKSDIATFDAELLSGQYGLNQVEYDASEAYNTPEEALLKGGWKKNNQGYYKVIGGVRRYLKIELLVNSNNSLRVNAAQRVCEQLNSAGIAATSISIEWSDLLSRINSGKFDMAFIGCRIPQIPDISYLYSNIYLPVGISSLHDAAYNVSGYSNASLDNCIYQMFKETDIQKRKVLYKEAKRIVMDDMPYIGLYFLKNAVVYSKNLRGQFKPDTWNRYNGFYSWYKP